MRLTKEQIKFYQDNGYIKLSGVFTDKEFEVLEAEYTRIFKAKNNENLEAAWVGDRVKEVASKKAEPAKLTVQSIHNLQYHSAVFSKILHHDGLLDALEDTMQTKNIVLHHTKAHIKPPGKGALYPMHQDYHYFPFKNDSMVAVFIHLDDTNPENGGLCIYPGSHKLGPLEDFGTYEKSTDQTYHYADPKKYTIDGATPVHAKRGDIVIFNYLTLHGSYLNLSERSRRMWLIQVRDAEDIPLIETHKSPGYGWCLRGRNDKKSANFGERHTE